MYIEVIKQLIVGLVTILPLLIVIAFFTLAERKIMGSIQRRRGPSVVGVWGLLQPLADGLKLLLKEIILPRKINIGLFISSALFTFFIALMGWAIIPFNYYDLILNLDNGLLYILVISSLGVYGIFGAGWSSNSKYAFLGAIRLISQMLSYEIILSLALFPVIILTGSLNFMDIVYIQEKTTWFIFLLWPSALIFFISMLAETNRAPFDLAEAESELVAGYNLEYSSVLFALFFLGEYSNIILLSLIFVICFLGGWSSTFILFCAPVIILSLKTIFICFLFILVRAIFPRYRYDQLMFLCWKRLMPFSLSYLIFLTSLLIFFDVFIVNENFFI